MTIRQYIVLWVVLGLIGLGPLYYAAYRIVWLLEEIRFILSVTQH